MRIWRLGFDTIEELVQRQNDIAEEVRVGRLVAAIPGPRGQGPGFSLFAFHVYISGRAVGRLGDILGSVVGPGLLQGLKNLGHHFFRGPDFDFRRRRPLVIPVGFQSCLGVVLEGRQLQINFFQRRPEPGSFDRWPQTRPGHLSR